MKKERNIITIDEYGRLNMPTNTTAIWMTETELAGMFDTTVGAVNNAIKAISKATPCTTTMSANIPVWIAVTAWTCMT